MKFIIIIINILQTKSTETYYSRGSVAELFFITYKYVMVTIAGFTFILYPVTTQYYRLSRHFTHEFYRSSNCRQDSEPIHHPSQTRAQDGGEGRETRCHSALKPHVQLVNYRIS